MATVMEMATATDEERRPIETAAAERIPPLRSLAVRSLERMYRPDQRLFAFRLGREAGRDVLEGVSWRYTATALIGLAGETDEIAAAVLHGQAPGDVCGGLIDQIGRLDDLGEVALTAWAARALHHPDARRAVDRLKEMGPVEGPWPTVELAWALTALCIEGGQPTDQALADALAQRLLSSFNAKSGLFPHWPEGSSGSRFRSHVTCFADFVYPVQALSHYHRAVGNVEAIAAAGSCARRMCGLQGPQGQWWWHFDVRTGRVIEGFPVYSVHQDSMAPMALFALKKASGQDHRDSIEKGLQWLADPPEIPGGLMDAESDVIWRKVARHEPGKLVRALQAAASRLHPALRVPATNLIFRPTWIDRETRPYHMAWILHAWPAEGAGGSPRQ